MRLVIDSLIALMLVAVLGGVLVMHSRSKQADRAMADTQQALAALHERTAYQTSVQSALAGHQQVMVQIDPAWFGEKMPVNLLASADRPWIDLAPPGDLSDHPPDPLIYNQQQAAFWYNPTLNVFRARVEPGLSEAQTLERYNQVNGTSLMAFDEAPDPSRRPMAHVPGQPPSRQYASLAGGWDETAQLHALQQDEIQAPTADSATDPAQDPTVPAQPAPVPTVEAVDQPGQPMVIHEVVNDPAPTQHEPIDSDDPAASPAVAPPSTPAPSEPAPDPDAPARPTLTK